MATSKIKGKTGTTLQAVTITPVAGAVVGAATAYLEGNLLKINAVLNLTGLTFANNDVLITISGYKAVGRSDFWAHCESDANNAKVKVVITNNSSEVKISAVANCKLSGFVGFYDFNLLIPVVPV